MIIASLPAASWHADRQSRAAAIAFKAAVECVGQQRICSSICLERHRWTLVPATCVESHWAENETQFSPCIDVWRLLLPIGEHSTMLYTRSYSQTKASLYAAVRLLTASRIVLSTHGFWFGKVLTVIVSVACSVSVFTKLTATSVIIGAPLPSLQELYTSRVRKRAKKVTLDPSHPAHSLFVLLPSGRRYRSLSTKTARHKNIFFPQAVSHLNNT